MKLGNVKNDRFHKETLTDEEKLILDVWNWKDVKIQPQQKVEAGKEKKRTFLAVYHLNLKSVTQLADVNVKNVSAIEKGNGKIGLGTDDSPYLCESGWTGVRNRDYYLVDIESGINGTYCRKKRVPNFRPKENL